MSNVRYDCPEPSCRTVAHLAPGGTHMQCPQHHLTYVQVDETPGSHIDHPEQYAEPAGYMQQPSSPDAVTNDGIVVGHDQGISTQAHPISERDSLVEMAEGTHVEGGATIEDPNRAHLMVTHDDRVDADDVAEQVRENAPLGTAGSESSGADHVDTEDGPDEVQGSNDPSPADDDIDGWRNTYRSATGEEPDRRWGVARIKSELGS
jgi:hypothetical protein